MKAQEFLDKEHYLSFSSKTQKKELKGLLLKGNSYSVNFKILEGDLDISDYSELRNNLGLECIDAHYNKIVANLNIFSHLVKLKHLSLGTTEKGSPNVWNYNDFHGSLKSLENCHNLEYLCIGQQTQIISGLEYLPLEKLIYFGCHGTVFQDMLKPFDYDILS
ncbi:10364_t:CDS:2 [Funneliformis geosporum]|nr:10364_t:CDS:2 [Funneliformis geosporum]